MESNKLYVGNLDYDVDEQKLLDLFEQFGQVISVKVIDGKGFGFIELNSNEQAVNAMEKLNDTEFHGRNLKINEARRQENKNSSSANSRANKRHGKRSRRKDNQGGRGY